MSVSVELEMKCTVTEVLPNNTGSASSSNRTVTHSLFNVAKSLNGTSTPAVTKQASFVQALTAGAATIDLTDLFGTNGASVDGTGLKVQAIRVTNLGAAALTIEPGASNGYDAFGASSVVVVPAGGTVMLYAPEGTPDIGPTAKTLDLTGTGTETSQFTIVMG
jgi:hypothetical protein